MNFRKKPTWRSQNRSETDENQFALADLEALGYAEADIVEDVGVAEIAKKPFVKQQKRAVAKMCT